MFTKLRRFLADDNGHLIAQDWMLVATVLMLGSALALLSLQRSLEEAVPSPRETSRPIVQPARQPGTVNVPHARPNS